MSSRNPGIPCKIYSLNANGHPVARHRGFSLMELMMSIILIAVSTSLAIPSYHSMTEKRLLARSAEQLAAFINSVRSISVLSNQVVTVSYTRQHHDKWCIGAVNDATACNCMETSPSASNFCAIDGQKYVMDNTDTDNMRFMHSMAGDGAFSFDSIRGLFLDLNDSLKMEMHSDSSDFDLNLMVSSVGKVILCSKTQHEAVPGYSVCI